MALTLSAASLVRRFVSRPAWGSALVTAILRVCLVAAALRANPFVRTPVLDGAYYLRWAGDIAGGDVVGLHGVCAGEPWLLNPLYAYLLAVFAAVAHDPLRLILYAQALLGGATAGLAAASATRYFGRGAGWVAGLLTAFAAPLAELDAYVSVAELAAFLVAGACFACAPATPGDRPRAHGPLAAGLWLGIGALARPITPVALPLVAWGFARRAGASRLRTGAVVVAAFAACAVPSLARNWIVSGEPAVYTAAGGINAWLCNNPEARASRSMNGPMRFDPVGMHVDAQAQVSAAIGEQLGRAPTRGEISGWYWRRAWDESAAAPGAALLFLVNKARWMFSPVEVPSSASLAVDLQFTPRLALAFVPTCLVAWLALAGAWAHRRRTDVLLGPGALALAHWAVLTLVFPLSHYRAPAIPAFAVLAGGAFAAVAAAAPGARRRAALGVAAVSAAAAVGGLIPPQPDSLRSRDEQELAQYEFEAGRLDAAERHARASVDAVRESRGEGFENCDALRLLTQVLILRGDMAGARAAIERALVWTPTEPRSLLLHSYACEELGDYAAAERDARAVVEAHPELRGAHRRLGEVLSRFPERRAEARDALTQAMQMGAEPDAEALRRAGL